MRWPTRRYDRRPMIAAAIAVIAIVAVAMIDFSITAGKVPEVPAPCVGQGVTTCEDDRNEEFEARLDRAFELEDGYKTRAWIYSAAAFAAALLGLSVALRRTERAVRREIFTDLGVAAVVGLGAGLVLAAGGSALIQTPTKQVLYPPLGLLVIAAVGTLATPRPSRADTAPVEANDATAGPHPAIKAATYAGFALSAAAVVLALFVFSAQEDPCLENVSDWVSSTASVALVLAALAALCGVITLFARRWMTALVMLSVGPIAALLAAFGTVCWN